MTDLVTRPAIKAIFETGDPLSQSAFVNLVDSLAINTEVAAKQNLLTTVDPRLLQAQTLFGAGNLAEWFDRQYSASVETTESGKSKRVAICMCGDSLAERITGWIAWQTLKDYPRNTGKMVQNIGWNLVYDPISYSVPSGPFHTLSGGATYPNGQYAYWPSGKIFVLPPGGIVTYDPQKLTTIKCAFIKEANAGTVVIETSPDGTTWTAQGAAVVADQVSTVGAVESRTVSAAKLYVRIRNSHGSKTLRLIGAYLGYADNVAGFDGMSVSEGGINCGQFATTPSAIYTPIMTAMNPALITFQWNDGLTYFVEEYWTQLMAFARAGNSNRSVLWICNSAYSGTGDADMLEVMRYLRSRVVTDKIAIFDASTCIGTYADVEAAGWEGDGVHMDTRFYAYCYQVLQQQLPTLSQFERKSDKETVVREKMVVEATTQACEIRAVGAQAGGVSHAVMNAKSSDSNAGRVSFGANAKTINQYDSNLTRIDDTFSGWAWQFYCNTSSFDDAQSIASLEYIDADGTQTQYAKCTAAGAWTLKSLIVQAACTVSGDFTAGPCYLSDVNVGLTRFVFSNNYLGGISEFRDGSGNVKALIDGYTGRVNFANLPTSASGLASGDLWIDTGAGRVIKAVA